MKAILSAGVLAFCLLSNTTAAQQTSVDLHLGYSRGTQTHSNSWGGGGGLQFQWGGDNAPLKVSLSPGGDYMKQENGPGTASGSLDLAFQGGGSSPLSVYAGVSGSENWSTGDNKQWTGAEFGREIFAGLQFKPTGWKTSFKGEERYGYIDGQEHTLTTRLGIMIPL